MQGIRSSNPPVVTVISNSNEFIIHKLQIFYFANMNTTAQKMKFSIKNFVSKYDQIHPGFGHIYWRNS